MENHKEKIQCPECGKIQIATVLHTLPWWTYVHDCVSCKHVIMESEWQNVERALDYYKAYFDEKYPCTTEDNDGTNMTGEDIDKWEAYNRLLHGYESYLKSQEKQKEG